MGNKLCAPWRKDGGAGRGSWAPKKDSHLLRLWAEIFQVQERGGDICWARLSDDVVPVNITCIADSPDTVFQITAYNRHVEKIFDVKLIQPGLRLTQASECFVHWKDQRSGAEWGLNFTSCVDARRFRDCCMAPTAQGYARKASSSGSLRLSPPKKVRGRKATSNPTSPLTEPRRCVASQDNNPEGGANGHPTHPTHPSLTQSAHSALTQSTHSATHGGPHPCYSGQLYISSSSKPTPGTPRARPQSVGEAVGGGGGQYSHTAYIDHIATVRGARARTVPSAQGIFDTPGGRPPGDAAACNLYDTVPGGRREGRLRVECDSRCPHLLQSGPSTPATKYRPIGERAIPYSQDYTRPDQLRRQGSQKYAGEESAGYTTQQSADYSVVPDRGNLSTQDSTDYAELPSSAEPPVPAPRTSTLQRQCLEHILYGSVGQRAPVATAESDQSDDSHTPVAAPRSSAPHPASSTTSASKAALTAHYQSTGHYAVPAPRTARHTQPEPAATTTGVIAESATAGEPRKSSSSGDWPPPPEGGSEPSSPFSPTGAETERFDSCTLRRMLQTLPACEGEPQPATQPDTQSATQPNTHAEPPTQHSPHYCYTPALLPPKSKMPMKSILRNKSSDYQQPRALLSGVEEGSSTGGHQQHVCQPATPAYSCSLYSSSSCAQAPCAQNSCGVQVSCAHSPCVSLCHTHTSASPHCSHAPAHTTPSSSCSHTSPTCSHTSPSSSHISHACSHASPTCSHTSCCSPPSCTHPSTGVAVGCTIGAPHNSLPHTALDSSDLRYGCGGAGLNYPDSGISGMTAGSVHSQGSRRSQGSHRSHGSRSSAGSSGSAASASHSQPALGLSSRLSRSTVASSSGSSERRSELIIQHGAETTSVTQLTRSDSESGSEGCESDASDSSIHTTYTEAQSVHTSKSTAVRKAGWLVVKNWLVHRKRRVELAPKRSWKKYWVCLKGTLLLFYNCQEGGSVTEDSQPRHMLLIEGGMAQAVPEHPKRENIFALSTAFGDAYLFQASSPVDLESWVGGLHSACASSLARQHGKENTLKLLRQEIHRLEGSIDLDIKMKKMADLQLKVVSDPKNRAAIEKQIAQWNENLEKLYIEQYRLRCYTASLQGSELPNPKNLLSCVSKATKASLSRLGVFTVTSFHALVCARTPLSAATLYSATGGAAGAGARGGAGATGAGAGGKKKAGLLSTFKVDSALGVRMRSRSPVSNMVASQQQREMQTSISGTAIEEHVVVDLAGRDEDSPQMPLEAYSFSDNLLRLTMPGKQTLLLGITEKMSVGEVLEMACGRRQLHPAAHFMRLQVPASDSYKIPDSSALLSSEEFEAAEICAKILFQVSLSREGGESALGVSVEAELADDSETEDELCVFISDVIKGLAAHRAGLQVGDEILVLDGRVISELDMVYVETVLQEAQALTLTVRSCRVARPAQASLIQEHADVYIENMVCPPPPSQSRISEKLLEELVIPAPSWVNADGSDDSRGTTPQVGAGQALPARDIDQLLNGAEQVTHFCRLQRERLPGDAPPPTAPAVPRALTESQRLRKVIVELIETERQYVKDLTCLLERYLEPLKEETFLSSEELEALFGNITEIVAFQRLFLESLESAVTLEPGFDLFAEPAQFRRVLFAVGGAFLHYANHFKLYSSFCASHSKAQKVLVSGDNDPLLEFLRARNPKQQHSATLESYLIKPIQRILKYPLLLRQLKEVTDPISDQHRHLSEALREMECVAEHINEMQKIYEEYGAVFEGLLRANRQAPKGLELNVGDLQMYGNVNWLNALDELGKIKKGSDIVTMLFVFKVGVVILAQERARSKRRGKAEGGDVVRFQAAIPVDELQVRQGAHDERQGLWELVHLRSEKEGRPETVYQYQSSLAARRDFLKTIHSAIRESVRRMNIPGSNTRGATGGSEGRAGVCRPTSTAALSSSSGGPGVGVLPRPASLVVGSGGGGRTGAMHSDVIRYSMNMEERVDRILEELPRSHTLTDLHAATAPTPGPTAPCPHTAAAAPSPTGSNSTLASETSSRSARLLQASSRPAPRAHAAAHVDSLGSPVWKARDPLHPAAHRRQLSADSGGSSRGAWTGAESRGAAVYGDYSHIVYDDDNGTVLPNAAFH